MRSRRVSEAWIYSRILGAGADQFIPNLRTMWPRTWLPKPNVKRPPDSACRSQPM